jgi:hypothetical protein
MSGPNHSVRLEFRPGDAFNMSKVKESIINYNDLEIYKFIDIDFFEKKDIYSDTSLLDCLIKLTLWKNNRIRLK